MKKKAKFPSGTDMVDALRARQMRVYARDGNVEALTRHIDDMLVRGCGPAERLELRELIVGKNDDTFDDLMPSRVKIKLALTHGRPPGPRKLVPTKQENTGKTGKKEVVWKPVERHVIGEATFRRLVNPAAPMRSRDVSNALKWGVGYFGISKPMARACLREHRDKVKADEAKRAKEEAERADWPERRAFLDSAEGRLLCPNANALIAFGDKTWGR